MTQGALLFDLDGTLLNSDHLHEEVFRVLFAERGKPFPPGFYMDQIHGRLNVDIFEDLLPEEIDPEALSREKEARFRDILPEKVPPMPGLMHPRLKKRPQTPKPNLPRRLSPSKAKLLRPRMLRLKQQR